MQVAQCYGQFCCNGLHTHWGALGFSVVASNKATADSNGNGFAALRLKPGVCESPVTCGGECA